LCPNKVDVPGYLVTGNKRMDFSGALGLLAIMPPLGFDGTAISRALNCHPPGKPAR
jgi:hypothetical protein